MASQRMIRHIRRDDNHSGGGDGRSGKQSSSGERKQMLDSDDTHTSNSGNDKDPNSQGKNSSNNNNNNSNSNNNNNNNNSPSSGSGSGGNNSSPSGDNSSSNNDKFEKDHCISVNENDGSLHYNGSWTLDTNDRTGLTATTHTANETGAQMSVAFNGTSVIVFGIVHQSNGTVPTANYSIDGAEPTTLSLPFSSHNIPNQQFFQSALLTQGEHNLTITVVSNTSSYTLDYLWFCGTNTTAVSQAVQASNGGKSSEGSGQSSGKTAIIVGSVLGTLLVIVSAAFVFVLWSIRKRRTRAVFTTSPLREWLSRQRETLLTSSDSIMRRNPSTLGTSTSGHHPHPHAISEKSSRSDEPVIRTFSDFDRHYSFPYPLKIHGRDRPMSSISSGQCRTSYHTSVVPVSPKFPKTPRDWT
ncbi:hypothetical protein QCA50_010850 [Cerrena zonata]|uniref:Uncharacterized protein n=1 Tax=Cerrena zonata TaxID=2478898 RepID=A0AAW0FY91_9APHY